MKALLVALVLAGCGSPEYQIAIVLPAGADTSDAVRVEVDVVRHGCDLVPESGAAPGPSEIVRPLGWTTGEPTTDVGDLVPGHYGFAARMRRIDCSVSYAGCAAKEIEEDGEGSITVTLAAVTGAACSPTADCLGDQGCIEPEPGT
jgi:hypothetical protein